MPALAPVVAAQVGAGAAGGGGVLASVGRILYESDLNSGEYKKLKEERVELRCQLKALKSELKNSRRSIVKVGKKFEKLKN